MKLNLPNIFTLSRAVLAPLFFFMFLSEDALVIIASVVVFIIAAITDYLDGWFARRFKESTDWGRVIDPLADKVLTTSAFVAFAMSDFIAWWMVIIVIVRDVATTYLRSYADAVHKPIVTSFNAKSKTFVQMTFIITVLVLVAASNLSLGEQVAWLLQWCLHPFILRSVMFFVTLFTAWTGVEYFVTNRHVTCKLYRRIYRLFKGWRVKT